MKLAVAPLLGALALCACSAWGKPPRHVFTLDFSIEDSAYALHVVVPHFLAEPKNDLEDFVTDLLRKSPRGSVSGPWQKTELGAFLQTWVFNHYRDIGLLPQDPSAELTEALRTTSSFDIARSGAAFVTPRGSKNILALARVDADSSAGDSLLGLEQFLIDLGRPTVPFPRSTEGSYHAHYEKNDFRLLPLPDGTFQFGMVRRSPDERTLYRPPGAAAEILNFNLVEGSYDFLPLLYLALDAFGITKWSGKTRPVIGDGTDGGTELVGIDNYYMHCEGRARKKYFEALGWTTIDTYPNPNITRHGSPVPNFVLTIDRATFKNTLERSFTGRRTFVPALLLRFTLDPVLAAQKRCQRILLERSKTPHLLGPALQQSQGI